MRKRCYQTILCMAILVFATASFAGQGVVAAESGLRYVVIAAGTGPAAEIGKIAVIHFTAWLDKNGSKGTEIFNSRDRGEPVAFKLGTDQVMEGWNIGVAGMKVGEKRRLMIPAALGYGERGVADVVPPNADLIFDIELIAVRS